MADWGDEDEDKDRRPHELRDIVVEEIALVDRPAIGRSFLLFKSENDGGLEDMFDTEEQRTALQTALNTPAPTEDEVLKAIGDVSDEKRARVVAALRAIGDDVELRKAIVGEAKPGEPMRVEIEAKPAEKPVEKEPEKKPDAKPEGDYVSKADHDAELAKRDDKIAALEGTVAAQLEKEDDEAVRKLVEQMDLPGASIEDQCKLLKGMTPEQREAFAAWGGALHKNIAIGDSAGTSRRGTMPESAQAEVRKRADEIIEKSGGEMDLADAMAKVFKDDPQLFARYRAEGVG